MKARFDFSIDAWIKGLELDVKSMEDAKEKLLSMSLEDILAEGGYVKDSEIKDLDIDIVLVDYVVKVTDIQYEGDQKDFPESMILTLFDIECANENCIEDDIKDAIEDKIDYKADVKDFKFEILEKK